jgi:Glyoxalase-like domain
VELDHVLVAVTDLDEAARELEERHGLTAGVGGRHAGWGTANRIAPLGATYLELIAVVDEDEAARSAFGSWVAAGLRSGPGALLGWVVRTDRIDDQARRLGLTVDAGSRRNREGALLSWRLAGVEQAAAEPPLPFFVEWGEGTPLPGRTPATHPAGAVRLERLELSGDPARLDEWVDVERLPVVVTAGEPAVKKLVLAGDTGEFAFMGL